MLRPNMPRPETPPVIGLPRPAAGARAELRRTRAELRRTRAELRRARTKLERARQVALETRQRDRQSRKGVRGGWKVAFGALVAGTGAMVLYGRSRYRRALRHLRARAKSPEEKSQAVLTILLAVAEEAPEHRSQLLSLIDQRIHSTVSRSAARLLLDNPEQLALSLATLERNEPGLLYKMVVGAGQKALEAMDAPDTPAGNAMGTSNDMPDLVGLVDLPKNLKRRRRWSAQDGARFDQAAKSMLLLVLDKDPELVPRVAHTLRQLGVLDSDVVRGLGLVPQASGPEPTSSKPVEVRAQAVVDAVTTSHSPGQLSVLAVVADNVLQHLPEVLQYGIKPAMTAVERRERSTRNEDKEFVTTFVANDEARKVVGECVASLLRLLPSLKDRIAKILPVILRPLASGTIEMLASGKVFAFSTLWNNSNLLLANYVMNSVAWAIVEETGGAAKPVPSDQPLESSVSDEAVEVSNTSLNPTQPRDEPRDQPICIIG